MLRCSRGCPRTVQPIMAFSGVSIRLSRCMRTRTDCSDGAISTSLQRVLKFQGFDIPLDASDAFAAASPQQYGDPQLLWRPPKYGEDELAQAVFEVEWEMTHVLGIASILHLFHRQFGAGVFADDFSYDAQWMPWSNNAITNQMLGSTAFPVRSTGASRFRKPRRRVSSRKIRMCFAISGFAMNVQTSAATVADAKNAFEPS